MCYNEQKGTAHIRRQQLTGGGIVKLINLHSTLVTCNDRLVEISGEHLYYTKEKSMENRQYLSLLDYNWAEQKRRVLADYQVTKPDYMMHYFPCKEAFLIVIENRGSEAWILKIDRYTGKELCLAQAKFAGNFMDCCALDADHVVFYSQASQRDASLFREYRRQTGYRQAVYLYDLQKDSCWSVQDSRICSGACLLPFVGGGEQKLLITKAFGSEEEKRKAFRNRRWVGEHIEDCVWTCTLQDFTEAVEQERPEIQMSCILRAGTEGMVRFAGEDCDNLYFRALYFPAEDQHILSVSKHTGVKKDVAPLNLLPGETEVQFVADSGRFWKLTAGNAGTIHVQGIVNSTIDASYDGELGSLIACLEDRYLILRDVMSDEKDSFVFSSICDTKTGKVQELEGNCAVKGNIMVLF